jgi:hypothetical protein
MRCVIAAALMALAVAGCTSVDPRHPPVEQSDTGHVDTGGGGGGGSM